MGFLMDSLSYSNKLFLNMKIFENIVSVNSCVSFQAEPLVIDLKDLFQLIFNMRKKEAEGSKKVKEVYIGLLHGHIQKTADILITTFTPGSSYYYSVIIAIMWNCVYSNKICQSRHPDHLTQPHSVGVSVHIVTA